LSPSTSRESGAAEKEEEGDVTISPESSIRPFVGPYIAKRISRGTGVGVGEVSMGDGRQEMQDEGELGERG